MFKFFQKNILWKFRFKKFFLFFHEFLWLLFFLLLSTNSHWLLLTTDFSLLTVISLFSFQSCSSWMSYLQALLFIQIFYSENLFIFLLIITCHYLQIFVDHFFCFNQCYQKISLFHSTELSLFINFKHIKQIRQLSNRTSYKIKLL